MKNLCKLFAMAMVLLCVAASCEKDGVYNPKQKIDRVRYSYHETDYFDSGNESGNYVQQVWNWNGNTLNSISFYDEDGDLDYTENYTYDSKKRLSEITWGGSGRYKLVYAGKRLSYIEYFYNSTMRQRLEFIYDGKNVSEIIKTNYSSSDYKENKVLLSPAIFRIILPNLDVQSADRLLARINAESANKGTTTSPTKFETTTSSIKFEWDGKNISRITFNDGAYRYYVTYSYDNMKNPFKGLFDLDEFDFTGICSANNIVKETYIEDDYMEEYEYTYTYDGKVPSTKTYSHRDSDYAYSYTYSYEYK